MLNEGGTGPRQKVLVEGGKNEGKKEGGGDCQPSITESYLLRGEEQVY